jgi:hypothetical protein
LAQSQQPAVWIVWRHICIVKQRDAVAIEVQKYAGVCICAQRRAEKYIVGRFVKDFNTSLMKP